MKLPKVSLKKFNGEITRWPHSGTHMNQQYTKTKSSLLLEDSANIMQLETA